MPSPTQLAKWDEPSTKIWKAVILNHPSPTSLHSNVHNIEPTVDNFVENQEGDAVFQDAVADDYAMLLTHPEEQY